MLLMIDNYDSFTYNIVQYLGELGQTVEVFRNDEITLQQIEAKNPEYIVISPGPCTPNEAGISLSAVKHFAGKIPLLGVCLGHQSIAQAFGGQVVRAKQVMHGKVSAIFHRQQGVFKALPDPFNATRYHSLVVEQQSLPDCFEVTAWTEQTQTGSPSERPQLDEIMGIRHKTLPVEGIQFHPESILTEHGHQMLDNFLKAHASSVSAQ